jgi:hypothetical protein
MGQPANEGNIFYQRRTIKELMDKRNGRSRSCRHITDTTWTIIREIGSITENIETVDEEYEVEKVIGKR